MDETARKVEGGIPPRPSPLLDHRGRAIDITPIRVLLARITAQWHPVEIWLFGSRARGDGQASSDWDLLVVLPDETADAAFDPLEAWKLRKDGDARADLVVCRDTDFREDRGTHNTLAFEAVTEGIRIA